VPLKDLPYRNKGIGFCIALRGENKVREKG
jgi:hypothetical protein